MMPDNKKLWEKLHRVPRYRPQYPNERVIQFVFNTFPRTEAKRFEILDYGCGAGRHLTFLAENGYQAYGNDVSRVGIAHARRMLSRRELKADLKVSANNTFPYPDTYFDGIISFGVLLYLSDAELKGIIPEIARVLKKGGKAFLVVRSDKDYRIRHARALGDGDYRIIGDKTSPVESEDGMVMHFFTKKEIAKRFAAFPKISIDEMYYSYHNKQYFDHDYVVILEK
jgi:SAM-dependent methyltransferase